MTIRARGVSPYRSTAAPLATTSAAAPSDSGDDDAGGDHAARPEHRLAARPASPAWSRGAGSRRLDRTVRPTGTISPANRPASIAATARSWLRSANASLSARVMPSSAATSSAVSPMLTRVIGGSVAR